jgi:hypothetical protein
LPTSAIVVPASEFDDRAGFGITSNLEIGAFEMMDPAIDAIDHGIGLARQFVVQAAFDQATENGWTCNGFVPVTDLIMLPWLQMRVG